MFTNKEVAQLLSDEAHSARINELIWIAAEIGSNARIYEALNSITDSDFRILFPHIKDEYIVTASAEELLEALIDHNYYGFLAEVFIPVMRRFKFNEGDTMPYSWSSNDSHCRIYWVYAETTDELVTKIKEQAAIHFTVCIEEHHKREEKHKS